MKVNGLMIYGMEKERIFCFLDKWKSKETGKRGSWMVQLKLCIKMGIDLWDFIEMEWKKEREKYFMAMVPILKANLAKISLMDSD